MTYLFSLAPLNSLLPLREFLNALPPATPLGLEVPNRNLAAILDLDERLRRTLATAKSLVAT